MRLNWQDGDHGGVLSSRRVDNGRRGGPPTEAIADSLAKGPLAVVQADLTPRRVRGLSQQS